MCRHLRFWLVGRGIYFKILSCIIRIAISRCAELVSLREEEINVSKVLNNVHPWLSLLT